MIPPQLRKPEFRFLKIQPKDKKPTPDQVGWQKNNLKSEDPRLWKWFDKGGNYGVIGGYGGLIILDADSQEVNEIAKSLPQTFTIKSGNKDIHKHHYYYILKEGEVQGIRLTKEKVGDLGDIRARGQYVVGANSIHPSSLPYKIIKDIEIAEISIEILKEKFNHLFKKPPSTNEVDGVFEISSQLRSTPYIRKCNVPEFLMKNKLLKKNTAKNQQLFPYVADILHNRQVDEKVIEQISMNQGHDKGAISGWITTAKNGKLMKSSCKKMKEYLWTYYPELEEKICGSCPLNKQFQKKKEIKENPNFTEIQKKILLLLLAKDKDNSTELIVEEIMKDNFIYTTKIDQQTEMWFYKEGIYVPHGKSHVKEICRKILEKAYTIQLANLVIAKIETDTFIEEQSFFNQNYTYEIPVKNGILNVITKELSEFNPKKIFFTKISAEFNEDLDCPKIDKFLKEILKDECDVKIIYELFGFILVKEYFLEKAIMFVGDGRNGKCLATGNKILMKNGLWKNVEDIKIGDKVISPQLDGSSIISKVKETHSKLSDVYEVREQARKKRLLYTCSDNHDIPIYRWWSKRTSKNDSTPRIRERKLFHYEAQKLAKMKNNNSDICSFSTTAVKLNNKNPGINPYLLGIWLGDGTFHSSNPLISLSYKKKKEIIEYVLQKDAHELKCNKTAWNYSFLSKNQFTKELCRLGMKGKKSGTKFIPKDCLISSIDYRFKLLAGLLDTDGFIQKKTGAIYYTTKSPQLAEDIKNLVFSLGGYCEIRDVTKSAQNGFTGKYKELSIQFADPFQIPLKTMKKERLKKPKYDPRMIGINVMKKPKQEMVFGFEIDSSSKWYVTDNWMITHNSKLLDLIKRFVSPENCSSIPLSSLKAENFSVSQLFGKLINAAGDISSTDLKDTGMIKALTGRDLINGKRKFLTDISFVNFAKMIFACNELPRVYDYSKGFWERWILLEFPHTFIEKERYEKLLDKTNHKIMNPNIIKDIISEEELSGLLNKSLERLDNLFRNKKFSYTKGSEAVKEQWVRKSDSFMAFCMDHLTESPEGKITKRMLRKFFHRYCKKHNITGTSDKSIKVTLQEMFGVSEEYGGGKNSQEFCWVGVKFRQNNG